jgi:hypothetical protein
MTIQQVFIWIWTYIKNNVRQLDQNDENDARRQDNDQTYHEDESDEEYLTLSASDKSHHNHANSAHTNNN